MIFEPLSNNVTVTLHALDLFRRSNSLHLLSVVIPIMARCEIPVGTFSGLVENSIIPVNINAITFVNIGTQFPSENIRFIELVGTVVQLRRCGIPSSRRSDNEHARLLDSNPRDADQNISNSIHRGCNSNAGPAPRKPQSFIHEFPPKRGFSRFFLPLV